MTHSTPHRLNRSLQENSRPGDPNDAALEVVLCTQISRVDARVQRGGELYSAEQDEVRRAADSVRRLRHDLGLDRFESTLTPETGKPQFLLLFTLQQGSPVVLKAYGRKRAGEARLQRLWQRHGIRTVEILDAGDDPTSWMLMIPLALTPLTIAPLSGDTLLTVTAELATLLATAHDVGSLPLSQPGTCFADCTGYNLLSQAITRHLGAVVSTLHRHGYAVRDDWDTLVHKLCVAERRTLLHGDLVPGNVVRDASDGGLRLLDSCAYVGPPEFDAARWAARTGAAQFGESVLQAWLQAEPELDNAIARALLGLEVLMEAGVRELVKDEQRQPARFPDEETLRLLAAADRLLNALGSS